MLLRFGAAMADRLQQRGVDPRQSGGITGFGGLDSGEITSSQQTALPCVMQFAIGLRLRVQL
jgi:hypothetical protein